MIDLSDQLPPHSSELYCELYAIYFCKPYDVEKAHTFMKIHNYSRAYMAESDSVIIFYAKSDYVPIVYFNRDIANRYSAIVLSDDEIYDELRAKKDKLAFKSYFGGKVAFIVNSN